MPLAFSTLGCPGLSLAQVLAIARETGADGLELRAGEGEIVDVAQSARQRALVREQLSAAAVPALTVASYVRICAPADPPRRGTAAAPDASPWSLDDPVVQELLRAIDLAADVGARYLRVFPGAGLPPWRPGLPVDPALAAADARGAARLTAAADQARSRGVHLALETHDSHPRAVDLLRIVQRLDPQLPVRVIWDVLHPWRHDEAPEQTAAVLAPWLAYVQFKDGLRTGREHEVELTLPGHGALPLRHMYALARDIAAQQGAQEPWASLEWERAWHPELPPVQQAFRALRGILAEGAAAAG